MSSKFGDKVARASRLAKERGSISLAALAVDLGVFLYYARTIAKAAIDLDHGLVLDRLFRPKEGEDPWSLYDKAWFEAERARLRT
ncbi:MAG: hypothetical protein ABSB29_01150 [Nitrososphaerales archaeon]|jgi:hypothetical protein